MADEKSRAAERKIGPDGLTKFKRWYYKNRETHLSNYRLYKQKLRSAVLDAYGRKCICCGESEEEFLVIDHIDGGGNKHRKSIGLKTSGGGTAIYNWLKANNYPEGFQTLCCNCNHSKFKGGGLCVHQRKNHNGAVAESALLR